MSASPTPGFTPSESQIRCAKALLVAQAHEQLVRPIVKGYQSTILAKHQFKVRDELVKANVPDEVITDGESSYLMSDEDFQIYLGECRVAQDAHGLKTIKPDNCPLLEAQHLRVQAENALLKAWEGHPRFSELASAGNVSLEIRAQAIELTLGLMAPHLKGNAHDMLAELGAHPATAASTSSPEP